MLAATLIALVGAAPQSPPAGSVAASRERARGDKALERLDAMSDADLRTLFESTKAEPRLCYREFDTEVASAYRRSMLQGTASQRLTVEKALRAALGDLATRSPQELAAKVTERGAADPVNLEMRDAALHLAMLARVTNDRSHADRSAALLERFAEVIPRWPIWNPYHEEWSKRKPMPQDDPVALRSEFAAGLWGLWIYFDLMMATPLAEAFSLLAPTGAIERLGAADAIQKMFDLHLETQKKFGASPDFSNMDSFQIQGYLDFGRLLRKPELVHEGARRLRAMYRTSFYPDGWWHEGSIGYHADLQNGLRELAENALVGYSDPPGFKSSLDGERFDEVDLASLVRGPSARAESVMKRSVMPDGNYLAGHDTPWPLTTPRGGQAPYASHLFGAFGQGSLISGSGDGLAIATMQWGKSGTHAHWDALNLNLWAKGTEAISETQYQPLPKSNSTRAWHTSTAAHATVVVNGVSQSPTGPRGDRRRTRQADDAIEGIPDWRWRWGTQAAQDGGDLRLFATLSPDVQVMEADAPRAYDMATGVTMYRRTIALVRIDDQDSYVVDIFRVKGGERYDFMLHASLQLGQTLRVSVPLQPMQGKAHSMIDGLRAGTTDGPWLAAFTMDNGVSLITFMAPGAGTTVIEGRAPSMRRLGDAPFVIARREGEQTTFVAVHHAFQGSSPRVQGIELVPTECKDCVAFKVRVGDRTDTVISCANRESVCTLPGGVEMRGLFAHLADGTTP
ncbi:MAG: hypothetical protein FJ253_05410, partial [Phycisphaerae bacterium]|nr:hypothetical protein [Phycisphaerae bacterium]